MDFSFDTLLMRAIKMEKECEAEGTEHDPAGATGFEAVQDPAISSSSAARTMVFNSPPPPLPTPTSLPPSIDSPPANLAHNFENSSESESSSDAGDTHTGSTASQKRKRKSKSKIAYKKLAFKKRRAADRQGAKDDVDVKVRASIRERHTSTAPINVPSFSLDTKVPARTGYVAMRDVKANKKVYKLHELVGEGSKFKFNLVEWDGE
jgi:cytoskeletal protein RodZ